MIRKFIFFSLVFFITRINAQVNLDFEAQAVGMYTSVPGWAVGSGTYGFGPNTGYCSTVVPTSSAYVQIVNTPFTIGPGATPSIVPVSPFGGTKVLRISMPPDMGGLTRVSQTVNVTPSNKIVQYAYFAILLGGDHSGICCNNHFVRIKITDCSGNAVGCGSMTAIPTTTSCANTGTLGMVSPSATLVYSPNWILKSLDLTPYIGSCVVLNFEGGECVFTGHFPDFYLDGQASASILTSTNICNTNTATLTAVAADSYSWTGPGGFTSNNQTVITATAGVYTLIIGSPGCINGNISQTVNVVIANTPTINTVSTNNSTICVGGSATLSVNGNGMNTYSWSSGANTQTAVVSPTTTTIYTVTVNPGLCSASGTVAVNVFTCTGIEMQNLPPAHVEIFPNPTKGSFTIKSNREEVFSVYDQLGRTIKEMRLNGANNYSANVTGLMPGVYFVSNKQVVKRVVVLE